MDTRSVSSAPRIETPRTPEAPKPSVATPAAQANTVAPADGFQAQASAPANVLLGAAQPAPTLPAPPPKPTFESLAIDSEAAKAAAAATVAAIPAQLPFIGEAGTFEPLSASRDELGMTHVRLNRFHNGLQVVGEQAVGHIAADGNVTVTGLMKAIDPKLGTGTPPISAEEAARRIETAFGIEPGTIPAEEMTRAIRADADGKYHDAWIIEGFFANALPGDGHDHGGHGSPGNVFEVDASTGTVHTFETRDGHGLISDRDRARAEKTVLEAEQKRGGSPARDTEAGEGNDRSLYSGNVEVGGTTRPDGTQQMLDTTRGNGVETNDAEGRLRNDPAPIDLIDNDGAWGQAGDKQSQRTGIDAQFGAQMTHDFLRDVLGRNSIDGNGEKLLSTVNVKLVDSRGNLAPNAFWNGTQMTYGMGDGRVLGDLTTVDIAGHEIAHGLVSRTAGLIYRNESGGINESIADIMGAGVEWYAAQKNAGVSFDWNIGEEAFTPGVAGDALRYMDDPEKDQYSIAHYSQIGKWKKDDGIGRPDSASDNGGVHGTSGIMNNAFFLTTEGGKNPVSGQGPEEGIGMESSLKIFGRALQYYMTPNSTFSHARESTLRAATDLFGADSKEVATLKQAWSAVGVE